MFSFNIWMFQGMQEESLRPIAVEKDELSDNFTWRTAHSRAD